MKQNQHQAGGKNNRTAQSKQARASAGKTTPETPIQPKLREIAGSNYDDQDLMVNESGPQQFYIRQQGVEGEPVRPISRSEAVSWFIDSFVPEELLSDFPPQPGEPARVSEGALDKLNVALNDQYETNEKNAALLHLLKDQIIADSDVVFDTQRLGLGIKLLCQSMAREVEARHEAVWQIVKSLRPKNGGAL